MNKDKKIIISALILWGIGALFHFVYEWINIRWLAWLFPVNESIFEHTKLVFLPLTLYYLLLFVFRKDKLGNLIYRCNISILIGIAVEVVSYYTISGILGRDIAWINILILLVSFIVSLIFDTRIDRKEEHTILYPLIVYLSLLFFTISMTYCPFDISFFYDHSSKKFGL